MALARWKDLCLDVTGPLGASPAPAFWSTVIGLPLGDDRLDGGDEPARTVWLNGVPEPRTVKNRVHLDVRCRSVAELGALGARTLSRPGEFRWTVMADPAGGEFCAFPRDEVPDYRLFEIVVDCTDAEAQARWWAGAIGGEPGFGDGYAWLSHADGAPFDDICFVPVPEPKTVKNRVHWDVTGDVAALVAHGASVLRERDDEIRWTVLADPEGNEFCVF